MLARDIEDLIEEFQRDHPRTTSQDIRQAVSIVSLRSGGRPPGARTAALTVAIGLLVAGLLGSALLLFRAG